MALENNMPTYTYVRYTGMQIVYGDNIYTIQDSHSNKKYLYWSITNPYTLEGVNVRKNQTVGTYLVIINDNGISTMPPQTDISINFDGNNPGLIQDKIFGIYDTVDGYGDRFVAIETDIEGIKQIVGEGGSDSDHNSIWEKISEIEQTAENIDLSVKETNRIFAENKEALELRENLNKSIIDFNSNLGIFKSEISGYFKDNLINDEEKISIETHISILEASKSEVILNVNKVVLIAESENQTTIVNSLNGAKTKFITAVDNLKTIINTAISDNTIVPSEITIITDLFAKCNVAVNELKNTCDEVIFLGAGGSISEELARIGIRSDEISLKVSKTEEKINTTLSIDKLALSGQITDVENAHSSLASAMKVIFENGEVSSAEGVIISEKISELNTEKVDIDNKYNSLYNNSHLSSSPKNALKIQYDKYVNKHNETIAYINEIISDTFVNEAEINNVSVHMNEYLSELGILHQKMNQAMDDIALNQQRAELQQAKDDLQGNINDVDNKVNDLNGYIDGTFNDNVLDTAERQAIKNNLDNLAREKSDIDNQYNQLINSRFLDGILKTNYTTAYNNFITKYNSLVNLINTILDKEDLINNSDRDNMNSKNIDLNESIGAFIKLSNEVIEYIARKESEYVKDLLDKDINDVDNKVNDLTNDINSTFKDNVIDESERKAIALNLKDLELQKIDIDNQYNQLVLSTYLDGELKVEFVNKYNALNIKYAELLDVMNGILNKEGLITDIDRTNLDNAKNSFGLSIGEYSTTVNKVIEYIGKKQSESVVGDFNSQLGALNDKVDSILDDVGGALADDIIDETERISIAQNLKELENELAKNSVEYLKIYNNVNLVGNIKTQLNTIYKVYETKHNQLVEVINYLINKVGLIDDTDRARLNTSYAEYKEALKNYVSISYDAIDSITNKGIEDAKNLFDKELGDLTTSLGNLEDTMNGVFKDGVLSEAEKTAIRQNLNTLGLEKADIDKSYSTIYSNPNLIGTPKTNLKTSYDSYVSSYNSLFKVINDILDKIGIVDDTDKSKMDTAFTNHKTSLSNFKEKYNAAIDSITNKSVNDAKESLQKEISDLNNSIVGLEDTMNNAFKDGVLSDAEKLAIKQNLQTISNEKADVDKQYTAVYNNVDLIGNPKTNLKNSYDDYVSKYNALVNVINNILNKVGLVDSSDQTNLNNTFSDYRTSSGVYSTKINEAIDSIAQKKADDAESSSKKYTESEIKVVNDAINLKVSQSEYNSNNQLVNNKFSEINQTTDKIQNTVSNIQGDYVGKSQFNQTVDNFEFKFSQSGASNLVPQGRPIHSNYDGWDIEHNCWIYPYGTNNIGVVSNNAEEGFVTSTPIRISNSRHYSLSIDINAEGNTKGGSVFIICGVDDPYAYDQVISVGYVANNQGWTKLTSSFTVNDNIKYIRVRIDNEGVTSSNGGYVVWFENVMILEGIDNFPNYRESADNIYNNSTSIDTAGVKVKSSNTNQFARINNQFLGIFDSGEFDINRRVWVGLNGIGQPTIQLGVAGINPGVATFGGTHMKLYHSRPEHNPLGQGGSAGIIEYQTDLEGTPVSRIVMTQEGDVWINPANKKLLNVCGSINAGDSGYEVRSGKFNTYITSPWNGYWDGAGVKIHKSLLWSNEGDGNELWVLNKFGGFTNINARFTAQQSLAQTYSIDNGIEIDEESQIANIDLGKVSFRLHQENIALKQENENLKKMDKDLVATNWDMDYRMCEVEWFLEDITTHTNSINMLNNMKEVNVMAGLSRYEQAKIIILGGEYDDKTLRRQLQTHFNRGNLTQDEYDELISLMDARDLVQGE